MYWPLIYGLEESDNVPCLVLELAERLAESALPIERALEIAVQIYRDLKPANVKVTPDGSVKVLDFGLAKAFRGRIGGDLRRCVAVADVDGVRDSVNTMGITPMYSP